MNQRSAHLSTTAPSVGTNRPTANHQASSTKPLSLPKDICPLCNNKTKSLNLHYYNYSKCSYCDHVYYDGNLEGAFKQQDRIHLRLMKANKEFTQNAINENHYNRIDKYAKEKIQLITKYHPGANSIIDMEGECGSDLLYEAFQKTHSTTRYKHLESQLRHSSFMTIDDVYAKYDVFLSFDYLEYEANILETAGKIYSRFNTGGIWICKLPIDNNVYSNALGRIHEFSNRSVIEFASQVSYNYEIAPSGDDSVIIVFRFD